MPATAVPAAAPAGPGRGTRRGCRRPQRRANLAGTFASRSGRRRPGRCWSLVDDVVTSGATLTEAAAALASGARPGDPPVLAAVVAATPRRRPGRCFAGRPAGCPEPARERPGRPSGRLSGPGGEGLASKRLQPVQPGGHMEIVVRGRNVEVPEHYRQHVEDKVGQLERFDGKLKMLRMDVELFHEKNPRQSAHCQRVEITLRGKGPVVRAEADGADFYAALDLAAHQAREPAAPRGRPPPRAPRPAHPGQRAASPTTPPPRWAPIDAIDLDRQLAEGSARHRPGRAPARPGRAGEAPSRHPHDRRPGPPRDGAGRPRLLPLPVRRHRPADGRLPPARLRLRPHPADRRCRRTAPARARRRGRRARGRRRRPDPRPGGRGRRALPAPVSRRPAARTAPRRPGCRPGTPGSARTDALRA